MIKSFIFVYMCEAYLFTSIPFMNQLPLKLQVGLLQQ
jgi:hypothetical protein